MSTAKSVYRSLDEEVNSACEDRALVAYSPQDKPWDVHRGQTDDVAAIYAQAREFERYAARMGECAGILRFAWVDDRKTGESRLRLREAQFCRVRNCPNCQWRRTLMWAARFYQALPGLVEQYPKARWLFLTLTARNCDVGDLGGELTNMNAAWQRLKERREFAGPVLGWIRTTEVTRGSDGSAHPHFHVLLMVRPSYFRGQSYVSQARWVELWQQAGRLGYSPVVDVRTVKPRAIKPGQAPAAAEANGLHGVVAEVLKYAVKPCDMTADSAWFLELTRQIHRRRFIASGGALKAVLRPDQESDEDLALTDNEAEDEDDGHRLAFAWKNEKRQYRRKPQADKFG